MRNRAAAAVLGLTMLVGCEKSGNEPAQPQTLRSDALAPAARVAPNREGTHETTPPQVTLAGTDSSVRAEGRTATIALRGSAGGALRGNATLTEASDAVEIALHLEQAAPGTHMVVLRDTGSCSRAEPEKAPAAIPKAGAHAAYDVSPQLGAFTVDPSGRGKLSVTVRSANLGLEKEGTLLGKALVIYPARHAPAATNADGDVIACAQIVAH